MTALFRSTATATVYNNVLSIEGTVTRRTGFPDGMSFSELPQLFRRFEVLIKKQNFVAVATETKTGKELRYSTSEKLEREIKSQVSPFSFTAGWSDAETSVHLGLFHSDTTERRQTSLNLNASISWSADRSIPSTVIEGITEIFHEVLATWRPSSAFFKKYVHDHSNRGFHTPTGKVWALADGVLCDETLVSHLGGQQLIESLCTHVVRFESEIGARIFCEFDWANHEEELFALLIPHLAPVFQPETKKADESYDRDTDPDAYQEFLDEWNIKPQDLE
jgi:hypothetical protein